MDGLYPTTEVAGISPDFVLNRLSVADVMILDVVTICQGASIEDAARIMIEKEVTHLPVISQEGKLSGIVTAWDVSKAVARNICCLRRS